MTRDDNFRYLTLTIEQGREVNLTLTSTPRDGLVIGLGMTSIRLPPDETERLWR